MPVTITLSEFKPMEKTVNVLINSSIKDTDNIPNPSTKEQSCSKE